MRKTVTFIMAAMAAMATFLFVSCDQPAPDNNEDLNGKDTVNVPNDFGFRLLSDSTTFELDWQADTIRVAYEIENPSATGMVQATSDAEFLSYFTQEYGVVVIYVAENMEFADRTATVALTYEDVTYNVTITQTARIYDQDVVCGYIQGYYYGDQLTPNTGIHSAQFYLSDTGWGSTGYTQDPNGSYFQINLYFPEQPEGTDYVPEGVYEWAEGYGEFKMYSAGSSYFPGEKVLTDRQLFTEGSKCIVTKNGDNWIIDLDVVTADDGKSRHARYAGPVSFRIL